ncbi:MAG: thioredoxin family protein [Pseudomonadota bacterium]|nr:thioredoxin family protein [Pseudomonadota bacterium]
MVRTETPICDFGRPAPDFTLPDPSGALHSLAACRGERGTLVMFICNHCPYVQAVIDRLVEDCRALQQEGVSSVAIMPNDIAAYPEDGPDRMAAWAREKAFPFPYLFDETQAVARAYGAVCTPDFFGYNARLALQYRGRLDASRKTAVPDARRDLLAAMRQVARTGQGPAEQIPSMGCSIKWREAGC